MLVGAEYPVGDFMVVSVITPARQAELDFVAGLGVPEDWVPHCRVLDREDLEDPSPADPGRRVDLEVGGQHPPRSVDELLKAVRMGLGLRLHLQAAFDLARLEDVFALVPRLIIASEKVDITGWKSLAGAVELESLLITFEPSEPLSIEALPRLRWLNAVGENAAVGAANPFLEDLELEVKRWPTGLEIAGPIEYLRLSGARKVCALPAMAHPEALRSLRVHYPQEFDLGSLAPATGLERVDVAPCPTLLNCETLLQLGSLRMVEFSGVKRMPGWERLLDELRAERFVLDDNYLVPSPVAQRVGQSRPRWHIGSKKPTDDERARRRFAFEDDTEQDATTFSPFTVRDVAEPGDPYLLVLDPVSASLLGTSAGGVRPPLNAEDAAAIIEWVINQISARLLRDGEVHIQIDEDAVYVDAVSLVKLERIARRLSELWRSPEELLDLVRDIRG